MGTASPTVRMVTPSPQTDTLISACYAIVVVVSGHLTHTRAVLSQLALLCVLCIDLLLRSVVSLIAQHDSELV